MTKKTLTIAVAAVILAAAAVWVAIAQPWTPSKPAAKPTPTHELPVAPTPTTPGGSIERPDGSLDGSKLAGEMTGPGDDGASVGLGVTPGAPATILRKAEQIARVWVSFDDSQDAAARKQQLAAVLKNPGDYADRVLPFSSDPMGRGNPTFHTKTRVDGDVVAVGKLAETISDGSYTVPVTVDTRTDRWEAGSTSLGSLDGHLTWVFTFTADGHLLQVIDPELTFQ